jgi:hypothetical protein
MAKGVPAFGPKVNINPLANLTKVPISAAIQSLQIPQGQARPQQPQSIVVMPRVLAGK